jgi:hypothetical protein
LIKENAMRIEMDAVINEYVLETLEAVPESREPPTTRERAVTVALKALMDSGLISHRYNATSGIDEFRATERLTRQWERDFLELVDVVAPTETIIVEIGKNSRTFSDNLMTLKGQRPRSH